MKSIAAIIALSVLAPTATNALGRDVSPKDIRGMVKQEVEVRKVKAPRGVRGDLGPQGRIGSQGTHSNGPGPAGAGGPPGPAGADGSPQVFFAHIFADGTIEQETAIGITQENVVRMDIPDTEPDNEKLIRYCISGLPRRIWGGQITVDASTLDTPVEWHDGQFRPSQPTLMPTFRLDTNTEAPRCMQRIFVWNGTSLDGGPGSQAVPFNLLLY